MWGANGSVPFAGWFVFYGFFGAIWGALISVSFILFGKTHGFGRACTVMALSAIAVGIVVGALAAKG